MNWNYTDTVMYDLARELGYGLNLHTKSRAKARLALLSGQPSYIHYSRSGPKSFMIGSPNYPETPGGLLFQNVSGHTLRLRLGLCQSSGGSGVSVSMWAYFQHVTADPCIVSHCTHFKGQKWWKLLPFA